MLTMNSCHGTCENSILAKHIILRQSKGVGSGSKISPALKKIPHIISLYKVNKMPGVVIIVGCLA